MHKHLAREAEIWRNFHHHSIPMECLNQITIFLVSKIIYLILVGELEVNLAIGSDQIAVNDLVHIHGGLTQAHSFQLNFALSQVIILSNIFILYLASQDHVIQSRNGKMEGLSILRAQIFLFGSRLGTSIVLVSNLKEN